MAKTISTGSTVDRGFQNHFENEPASACIICVNAKVCIENRNFHPAWGLHNSACGTVGEIVYKPGESPLAGNQLSYVVVDFL